MAALALACAGFAQPALADAVSDAYPSRPVRIIVPVSAGGSTDILARAVAQELGKRWGQAVIVENVTGAGGAIGASRGAKSNPDGYTLVVHSDAIVLNTILLRNAPYSMDDFTAVGRLVVNPQILVANPQFEAKTFTEYVQYAKAHPGELSLGLPTSGGIAHIAHAVLAREAGIKVNYIPYKGGEPAAVDTIAGHINATVITLAAVAEPIKAGQLRPLAVTTTYRSRQFPDVPTMAESGYPNVDVESWQGMLAPKGTPAPVVEKINQALAAALKEPALHDRLEKQGFVVAPNTAGEFAQMLKDVRQKYAAVIEQAGITHQ